MSQTQRQMSRRTLKKWASFISLVGLPLLGIPAFALSSSVDRNGIDARRLHEAPYNLTGAKIAIGQVEIGRPAQFGLDKVSPGLPSVAVSQVFFRDGRARANQSVDSHAAQVASVMISDDKTLRGVAPGARLYSAAVGSLRRSGQPEECLSSQHVALQNGGDVRAINFSFGEPLYRDPRTDAVLDGNALLTQCIDWSSRVHNVLYVIAGNQGRGGIPIPTDNFNGINVAYSTQVDGVFNKVDFANLGSEPNAILSQSPMPESNVGPRRSISLVAPGSNVELLDADGSARRSSGTSFASPHVTAAVALLQELGDRQIAAKQPQWSLDARQPQVMKAVLLNSADKVQDTGDGLRLGMTRTLRDRRNQDWLESDAYRDPKLPLHADLGTGHLNAFRAYQQFNAGQWTSEAPVPVMGWDYATVATDNAAPVYRDYVIEAPLKQGSFVSITLAWDRWVELQDANQNELYDLGETFRDRGLNNLDLYLMRADETDPSRSVWSSVSEVDSIEHIFHQIPETGRYKIRVVYRQQAHQAAQNYALAWWSVPVAQP